MNTMEHSYILSLTDGRGVEHHLWVEDKPPRKGDFVLWMNGSTETTGLVLDVNDDDRPTRFCVTYKSIEAFLRKTWPHGRGVWTSPDKIRPLTQRNLKSFGAGRLAALMRESMPVLRRLS